MIRKETDRGRAEELEGERDIKRKKNKGRN